MAKFTLDVPLDASGIEDFKPDADVKVLIKGAKESQSKTVKFSEKGFASASFAFSDNPGSVRILVGPASATDEELEGLQTLAIDIPSKHLEGKIPPIKIAPYFWWWWRQWCREFVIRGRVLCADGSPVPGAKVCAADVDWWFFWTSTQQVGCAYTDINGAFEMKFNWCCNWWPWWWWRHRIWNVDSHLAAKLGNVMARVPDIGFKPPRDNRPNLSVFGDALSRRSGLKLPDVITPENAGMLESIRKELLEKLPFEPELERLRIWPWWPWHPWRDCAPDIIFRVTQDCNAVGTVIVDESVYQTRWDIPTTLDVVLTANDKACCRRVCDDPPCEDGECLVVTRVCGATIDRIGGNLGAPMLPSALDGYLDPHDPMALPGTLTAIDRPFAAFVPVEKNSGALLNVDYYEIEWFDGLNWVSAPPGGVLNFARSYMHLVSPTFPTTGVPFNFSLISDGSAMHNVVESKEHWEANSGLAVWGFNYIWISNEFLLVPFDSSKFTDGAHRFRVVGWNIAGSKLTNRRVLPVCATEDENSLVLQFDNREIDPFHPAAHNCGAGVHICTTEPDTHISLVRVNGQMVTACGTVDAAQGDLEVEFLVTDPDGHLSTYALEAHYGLSGFVNLLTLPGATVTALAAGTQTGWNAADGTASYGKALSQGAVQPHWFGGQFRLVVPAAEAFPIPCCYQLKLIGWKRNLVSCSDDYRNITELALGVGVCPPVN